MRRREPPSRLLVIGPAGAAVVAVSRLVDPGSTVPVWLAALLLVASLGAVVAILVLRRRTMHRR
ncbi:hypothetical protein ACI784_14380 [Geodermatophilus sp. SYSU D01186]